MEKKSSELLELSNKIVSYVVLADGTDDTKLLDKLHKSVGDIADRLDEIVMNYMADEFGVDMKTYADNITDVLTEYVEALAGSIDDNKQ